MRRVSVTELKNKLSQFLRLVKRGETIEIVERSTPIARIEALTGAAAAGDERLERLVREGVVTPAVKKPGRDLLRAPPAQTGADPVAVLVEERSAR